MIGTMRKLTSAILVAITAALPSVSGGIASAAPAEGTGVAEMPLTGNLRACDHTMLGYVYSRQNGRAIAHISTPGSNTVMANVELVTAVPYTHYYVRLIQTPRTPQNCVAGDPGVISGDFQTDAVGAGGITVSGPIKSGATGAWVVVDTPSPSTQTPAEFYTGAYIAAI